MPQKVRNGGTTPSAPTEPTSPTHHTAADEAIAKTKTEVSKKIHGLKSVNEIDDQLTANAQESVHEFREYLDMQSTKQQLHEQLHAPNNLFTQMAVVNSQHMHHSEAAKNAVASMIKELADHDIKVNDPVLGQDIKTLQAEYGLTSNVPKAPAGPAKHR